jgi:serine/threonine protein kinase
MDAALPQAIGNYRVVSKLGQGGMGAVYHAVQGTLERPCALKILPAELSMNHEYVTRFLREARSVAQLRHENIVQVYDAGQDGLNYFIAMELVDGCDLQTYIEKKGQISEAEGLKLLLQAAKGLAAAHAKGLVHRDIKPQNLLMGNDGMLRIVDFGLVMESTSTTQLTATGACLGTPMYMSPEQADGETADSRTDVYSLGVTFFRVFTGQLPFSSNTVMNLLFKHKFEAPPDPKGLRAELSENTRRLLLHMIAKQRENRPQDGAKLVEMIETIQAGKSLPPPPVQTVQQAGGTSIITPSSAVTGDYASSNTGRKTPVLIVAGVAAAFVLALIAFFVLPDKKNEHFTSGENAFAAGRYKDAAEHYKLVLAAQPDHAEAKAKLAQAEAAVKSAELFEAAAELEKSGNLPSAAARYQDAAALDTTGKAKAEYERVKALIEKNQALTSTQRDADRDRFSKLASDAERAGNFESAAESYSRAAQLAEPPLKGVLADKAQECRRQSYVAR